MADYTPLRVSTDGERWWVARDRLWKSGPRPEHASVRGGSVGWVRHKEGGMMEPLRREQLDLVLDAVAKAAA